MGQPLMPPAPSELASSLRMRLERILPIVRGGRGRDLDFAAASLEAAIGELGALLRGLAAGGASVGSASADAPVRIQEISQEIEQCRGLVRQLARLLEQAKDTRLAHWTPAADGTYTAQGGPAPALGPRLVRHVG